MKLTAKGRYAVMALADLAARGADVRVNLADIASRQAIPLPFLEQLFGKLRRAGLVQSYRGAQGGYQLARPAESLSVAMIIHAVDAGAKAHGCSPETRESCTGGKTRCLTHDLWGALEDHIDGFLSGISLQDVVDGGPALRQNRPVAVPIAECAS